MQVAAGVIAVVLFFCGWPVHNSHKTLVAALLLHGSDDYF